MAVITMSRQIGSGAEEVAAQLCQDLGLVAFDKRVMMRVASEIGLGEDEIVDYSDDQYKRRGFFDRLFDRSRSVAEVSSWTGGRAAGYEREVMVLDEPRAVDLVRTTINAACERGNVLVIGRGGQAILEDNPSAFHIRIVAPFEDRVQRLQAEQGLTAAQARRLITERDQAKAEYLRRFHNIDVDDPSLYHMALNTGKLGIEKCVALIKAGVQEMAAEAGSATTV